MSAKKNSRRNFLSVAGGTVAAAVVASTAAQAQEAAVKPKGIKIIAISCSTRKGKTTAAGLTVALESAKNVSPDIEVELIEIAGMNFLAPPADGDDFSKVAAKMTDPKVAGIIMGSPVYNGSVSGLGRTFTDRWSAFRKTFALRDKVGGALGVGGARNGGVELIVQQLLATMFAQDMIMVGDGKPTAHSGATLWNDKDSIEKDEPGLKTAQGLGRRVAEVALRMAATRA